MVVTEKARRATAEPSAHERRVSVLRRIRLRRVDFRSRPYRRWTYAAASLLLAAGLFALGTVVTRPALRGTADGDRAVPQTAESAPTKRAATFDSDRSASSEPGAATTVAPAPAQDIAPPVPPGGSGSLPPKIVRNADIQVQVKRDAFDRTWNRALNVAARYGGFVTNSSTQQTDSRISSGSFTLRVPAPKLDAALKDLRELGTLKSLTTSGSDISAQIVDVDGRIRALQAEQAQLLELLKRADRVADILPIRTQLQSVQQELESLRGQKKGLQNQVDYATVNATIFEPDGAPEPLDDGIILRAWRTAISAGLTIVAGTLVVLGGLVPLGLIAVGVWALVAFARRRRA